MVSMKEKFLKKKYLFSKQNKKDRLAMQMLNWGTVRIGPLPNLVLANRPPKIVNPLQTGLPINSALANRLPVKNLSLTFTDLQKAFD